MGVRKIETIKIKGYLYESQRERFIKILKLKGKILVIAPTGKGKTYCFINVCKEIAKVDPNKVFIFAVPQVTQVKQNEEDFNIFSMYGEIGHNKVRDENIIGCTYDQLDKIIEYFKDSNKEIVLIIDECHEKIFSSNYREKAIRKINNAEEKAVTVIHTTATPNILLKSYKYDEVIKYEDIEPKNKIVYITESSKDKKGCFKDYLKKYLDQGQQLYVTLNDKKVIEEISEYLKSYGYNVGIIVADDKQNNKQLEEQIIKNSFIPKGYDIVFTTSKMEAGANIKNKNFIPVVYYDVNTLIDKNIIQAPNRLRNSNMVFIYKSISDNKTFKCYRAIEKEFQIGINEQLEPLNITLNGLKLLRKDDKETLKKDINQILNRNFDQGKTNMNCIFYNQETEQLEVNQELRLLEIEKKYQRQFAHNNSELEKAILETGEYNEVIFDEWKAPISKDSKESCKLFKEILEERKEEAFEETAKDIEEGKLIDILSILDGSREYTTGIMFEEDKQLLSRCQTHKSLKTILETLLKNGIEEKEIPKYLRLDQGELKKLPKKIHYVALNKKHNKVFTYRVNYLLENAKAFKKNYEKNEREYICYRVVFDFIMKRKNKITKKAFKELFNCLNELKLIKEKDFPKAEKKLLENLRLIYTISDSDRVINLNVKF